MQVLDERRDSHGRASLRKILFALGPLGPEDGMGADGSPLERRVSDKAACERLLPAWQVSVQSGSSLKAPPYFSRQLVAAVGCRGRVYTPAASLTQIATRQDDKAALWDWRASPGTLVALGAGMLRACALLY